MGDKHDMMMAEKKVAAFDWNMAFAIAVHVKCFFGF